MNDISRKWEKWFHTRARITLIACILCNDQLILLFFLTHVKETTNCFFSTNEYCEILRTFEQYGVNYSGTHSTRCIKMIGNAICDIL